MNLDDFNINSSRYFRKRRYRSNRKSYSRSPRSRKKRLVTSIVSIIVAILLGSSISNRDVQRVLSHLLGSQNATVIQTSNQASKKIRQNKTNQVKGESSKKNSQKKENGLEENQKKEIKKFDLVRVVDGDTIHVMMDGKEVKIRLIGIDTPEAVSEQRENVPAGEVASRYVKSLFEGVKEVGLEFDEEPKDQYGRYLAYVYLPDGDMVNLNLAKSGMVRELFFEPNTRHKKKIHEAIVKSRKNKIGLWKDYTYEEMFPGE